MYLILNNREYAKIANAIRRQLELEAERSQLGSSEHSYWNNRIFFQESPDLLTSHLERNPWDAYEIAWILHEFVDLNKDRNYLISKLKTFARKRGRQHERENGLKNAQKVRQRFYPSKN